LLKINGMRLIPSGRRVSAPLIGRHCQTPVLRLQFRLSALWAGSLLLAEDCLWILFFECQLRVTPGHVAKDSQTFELAVVIDNNFAETSSQKPDIRDNLRSQSDL